MYEKHFGLNSRPFAARAEDTDVFVGPRQTETISRLGKGLQADDAVVTITGPVGVGKTTIVNRALASVSPDRTVIRIGRMPLGRDEVLLLLLAGCGSLQPPRGTIQQFAAFRRHLHEKTTAGSGITIVVEDAHRIGSDTLAEIETLTAADAGDDASASIVIMGQSTLYDLLGTPDLARLKQRIRLRQNIEALTTAEVLGYLKHSIRNVGGDFDAIFDDGVADIVFHCSEGIPRIINTLCETALADAAENNTASISTALMQKVAADAFGYEDTSIAIIAPDPVDEEIATAIAAPDPVDEEIATAIAAPDPVEKAITTESTVDVLPLDEETEDVNWEALPIAEFRAEAEIVHNVVVESGRYPNKLESVVTDPGSEPEETGARAISELIEDTQAEIALVNSEQIAVDTAKTGSAGDDEFDLDAALSPESDETNIMHSVTDNLDGAAHQLRQADAGIEVQEPDLAQQATTNPVEQEPPALAISSRVDVKKIVGDLPQAAATVTSISDRVAAPEFEPEPAAVPDSVPNPEPDPAAEIAFEPVPEIVMEEAVDAIELDSDAATDISAVLSVSSANQEAEDTNLEAALDAALEVTEQGNFATDARDESSHGSNGSSPNVNLEADAPAEENLDIAELSVEVPEKNTDDDDFARQIGAANSLEDISDFAAETIFGCEALNEIAANVVANPPSNEDSHSAVAENPAGIMLNNEELSVDINGSATEELALHQVEPASPIPESTSPEFGPDHLRQSVAMRIDMLQSLKKDADTAQPAPAEVNNIAPVVAPLPQTAPQPEPIERQINTSITQTLEALNVARDVDDEKNTKEKSGGFFSRFKRSS